MSFNFYSKYDLTEPLRMANAPRLLDEALQRWLERFGLAEVATAAQALLPQAWQPPLQAALLSTGLLPPQARSLAQDMAWLADAANERKPYAAAAHCLCLAP
mgnify:CR=1 FL=1